MVDIYKTDNKILSKLGSIEEGCWINMVNPTSSELSLISGYFDIHNRPEIILITVFIVYCKKSERQIFHVAPN